jgi:hypothetical protein
VDGTTVSLCFSEPMAPAGLDEFLAYWVDDSVGQVGVFQAMVQPGNVAVNLGLARAVSGRFTVTILMDSFTDLAGNLLRPGSSVSGVSQPPLSVADIGSSLPPGSVTSCVNDVMTVTAGGENIGGASDQFTYVYGARTNDFDVRVRVESLDYIGHRGSKAALVIRESLEPASATYMLNVYPTEGDNFFLARIRPYAGEFMRDSNVPGRSIDAFPIWLRVKRSGPNFVAYTSRNGLDWDPFGEPQAAPQFPAVLLVGLGTSSHINATATQAGYGDFGDTRLYPNAVINISEQPADVTVEQNHFAKFTVAATVSGAPAGELQFQWQAETSPGSGEFTNIFFAIGPGYTTGSLPPDASGTGFRVLVSVSGSEPVVSNPAHVLLVPDMTPPRVITAHGTASLQHIQVSFSEPMALASLADPTKYSASRGLTVLGATPTPAGTSVLLTLDGYQSPGETDSLTLCCLADLAGNALQAITVPVPTLVPSIGFALRESYFDIQGVLLSGLRDNPKFPSAPDLVDYAPGLEGFTEVNPRTPTDTFDNYGLRLSGFLRPPVSGAYHFYIASDAQSEFWLSADASPAHRTLICSEPQWNPPRDWTGTTRRPNQENRSTTMYPAGIPLVAGNRYYFEALMKEGSGDDHVAVAWQLPGEPIPANGSPAISAAYLEALTDPTGVSLVITQQPQDTVTLFDPLGGAVPRPLFSQDFEASDGGFIVITPNLFSGPWRYDPVNGTWRADGQEEELRLPMTSRLRTPTLTVTHPGHVRLTFRHRYSFEFDDTRWDGGNLRISVNGSSYRLLPGSAFAQNGYDSTVALNSASELRGQPAFTALSAGHGAGTFISATADLGYFFTGDTVSIEFTYGGDTNMRGDVPNWEIDSLSFTQANPGQPPVTFTVGAAVVVPGSAQPAIHYQWERDCGSGFVPITGANGAILIYVPSLADNGCRFRVRLYMPGATAVSAVATLRVEVRIPTVSIRREPPSLRLSWDAPGTLQQAGGAAGPWFNVPGATNTSTFVVPAVAAARFYRVRVP